MLRPSCFAKNLLARIHHEGLVYIIAKESQGMKMLEGGWVNTVILA
jgi:hypothetical protein